MLVDAFPAVTVRVVLETAEVEDTQAEQADALVAYLTSCLESRGGNDGPRFHVDVLTHGTAELHDDEPYVRFTEAI